MAESRWIIVSNRLPLAYSPATKSLTKSSGGLVTAIEGIQTDNPKLWVGCAPSGVSKESWKKLKKPTRSKIELCPLFIDQDLYDEYYNGFSNDSIWPLLHYESERTTYRRQCWKSYQRVNEIFADELAKVVKKNDVVWIHDFHFFLLPKMLRERVKNIRIGFFLHVPFPSSEIFRQMPHREALLKSVLASDLIGFHDYSYLRHFCSSLLRILGIDSSFLSVRDKNHTTNLGVFPVSIDTSAVAKEAQSPKTLEWQEKLKTSKFVFLGVDRLDYTKGVNLKLEGYRRFLEKYPEMHEKVRLVQIAVPTRTDVADYQELKHQVDGLVGEINGEFGTSTWTPVRYVYSSVAKNELMALYRGSNALLVTSKRDGMNLVALEYIAAQNEKNPGVVLLSEFAGAMSMLGQTIPINPWNPEMIADRMHQAIEMPREERLGRWQEMYNYLKNYTATDWASAFIRSLEIPQKELKTETETFRVTKGQLSRLISEAKKLGKKKFILMLDYDGTLTPIVERPSEALLSPETRSLLGRLAKKSVDVVIISGRPGLFLEQQVGLGEMTLAAEHGGRVYLPEKKSWQNRGPTKGREWYKTASQIMEDYARRVQNSFVEKKTFALAWHYRQSPPEYASYIAKKLQEELEIGLANMPVTIISGKKVLEVRAVEANKGSFATEYLQNRDPEGQIYPIAIGDDRTDEDLFAALKAQGATFKVGPGDSQAHYKLESQEDVIAFLRQLDGVIH